MFNGYKINWLNIKVLKTAASSKSFNLYLYTFIIKCSQLSRREPPTMGNQLVSFMTFGCESSAPFFIGTPDPKGHVTDTKLIGSTLKF
jgi:hypothetical protein